MKPGQAKILGLLDRRVELLRALLRTEAEWRCAFIAMNMRAAELCTAEEELICGQIVTLDSEISVLQAKQDQAKQSKEAPSSHKEVDPVIAGKIRVATARIATLHAEVQRSNQVRQAILKRSRLTLNALRNLFNSHAPTYGAPATARLGTIYEESV